MNEIEIEKNGRKLKLVAKPKEGIVTVTITTPSDSFSFDVEKTKLTPLVMSMLKG